MKARWRLSALIVLGCFVVMVGGCTKDPAIAKQRHLERATTYYAKGQYNEAIIELKNALQIDPKFPPAVHLMGRAFAAKSWHLDAMREFRRAVELQPDNLEAHLDLGRVYVKIDAWADALKEASTVAEKDPANATAMYLRAAALNAKGERQGALAAIDKALAAGQSSPEFLTVRGDILVGLERFGEAEQAYRAALAQTPKDPAALGGLGDLLRRQNRPDEARKILEQAKADNPTNASVRLALGGLQAASGKFDDALKELETLPRQNWTPRVALMDGQLNVQTGHFTEAVAALSALKQIFPDLPAARYWLGHAFRGLNRLDDALLEFRAAAQKAPDNVLIRFGLAQALLDARQAREALAELNKLAKPMEKVPDYHLLLGRTQLALGATDDAIKTARATIALAPQDARAYTVLGTAYAAKGDLRAAHDAYAKGVEVDPTFTPGRIALGQVYDLEKKPEDALKEYDAALAKDPRSQAAVAAKVATLVRQDRLDQAIAFAQTVAKSDPKKAAAHELLARLYARKNDIRSAEQEVGQALKLDDGFVPARLTAARIAIETRKPADGIPHLQRVLKDQPGNVTAALMLADVHAREFRYDQAIPVLESATQAAPGQTALTLALANVYIRSGRFDDAVTRLAPLLKDNPDFIQARFLTGLAQLSKGDLAGAGAHFEAVTRLNPQLPQGHYYLGRTLLAHGNGEGAKEEYKRAAELAPDSKQIKMELAALTGEKPDPAIVSAWIEELKAALAKDPTNTARREELGQAYAAKNQLAEAEAEFKRVLETSPLSPTANRAMALIRLAQKKPDEAASYLQTVLRVEPANIQANVLLARHYQAKGNPEQAIPYMETVYRTNPGLGGVKLHLAQLYGVTGRVAQGLARAKEAVANEPKSAAAHTVLGMLYLQNGDVTPAIDALTSATRLDPNSAAAQFNLATAYERKGDTATALAGYKRTIALNPKTPEPYNNIAYTYAAQAKNLDEALAMAQKAREFAPNNGAILDTLGFVYYQRGEYQKAEPILKKATELQDKNATIFYHLGATYYKLGRREDAAVALRRSLQLQETIPQAAEIRALLAELKK